MIFKKAKEQDPLKNRRLEDQRSDKPTVIATTTAIQGTLTGTGTLHISGNLKGDVRYKGLVWVGNTGKIEGTVNADGLIVEGQINGNIESADKTELRSGSRVTGDIHCGKIAVAEDCFFQGEIKMSGPPGSPHTFTDKRKKGA